MVVSLYNSDTFKIKNLESEEFLESRSKLEQDDKEKNNDFEDED